MMLVAVCFFLVSPCRQLLGGEDKLQPIVEYKPQRSYNRSAVGVTRMSVNVTVDLQQIDIYVVLLKALQFNFKWFLSTVGNLGISEELKAKLQDVMVTRTLLSIGKVLGEG